MQKLGVLPLLLAIGCSGATAFLSAPALRPLSPTRAVCSQSSAFVVGNRAASLPPLRKPIAARRSGLTSTNMAVEVEVKDLPNSQKKLTIAVSADECNKAYEAVLGNLVRQAEIPGFRKGKAPPAMVVNHFGKQSISAEACEKIIGAAVPMALQQKGINAIGQAKMADDNAIAKMLETFSPGESVDFDVLVDVWPEAKLEGSYTGLTLEAEKEPFEEELVSNALSELRKREATSVMSGADTPAKVHAARLPDDVGEIKAEGVVAVCDLTGYTKNADGSKGDKLPDLAIGENVEVVMEKGKFFEGFVEAIEGMKAGETAAVPITFPSNHKVLELRGVEALFDVNIKALKDNLYPALTDEFAQKCSEAQNLDELKEKIREGISQESVVSTKKNIEKAIESEIIKLLTVEIPETLIDEQTKTKFASMMSDFKAKGMDDEQVKAMITKDNFDKYKKTSRENTVRALEVSFAIGEIAKKEGIKVDPQEIEAKMVDIRMEYQGEEIDEEQARSRVEAELEKNKVMEFLKENNKIELIEKKEEGEQQE